jgi:hypothetical protein
VKDANEIKSLQSQIDKEKDPVERANLRKKQLAIYKKSSKGYFAVVNDIELHKIAKSVKVNISDKPIACLAIALIGFVMNLEDKDCPSMITQMYRALKVKYWVHLLK